MRPICRKIVRVNLRWGFRLRVSAFQQLFRYLRDRLLACSAGRPSGYRRGLDSPPEASDSRPMVARNPPEASDGDSDNLVSLKISLLGDCRIGKTSFVVKYVGDEQEKQSLRMSGLNLMDKMFEIKGARIAFRLWDVGGDAESADHVPLACKDAVAILIMFDLTSRCTLNSVVRWHSRARRWNQTAMPILIGTKFDDFSRLPPEVQSTIVTQARGYARAMKATLFFSSATHNINVNKIFKFIMAKLFSLPWTLHRNLQLGEPIIDFY